MNIIIKIFIYYEIIKFYLSNFILLFYGMKCDLDVFCFVKFA